MAPAGSETGRQNAGLTAQLWNWSQRDGSGLSFDSSTGYVLPNSAICSPDASWVVRERWEAIPPEVREKFAPICPDFAAELRSPSDDLTKLRDKVREYIDQGARFAWLIDPKTCKVEVFRPDRPVETLKRPTSLSGEDVLPGFVLDLRGILFD